MRQYSMYTMSSILTTGSKQSKLQTGHCLPGNYTEVQDWGWAENKHVKRSVQFQGL